MLGAVNSYRRILSGLEATETALPAHYLVPMTRLEIDSYIFQQKQLGKASKLAAECDDPICFMIMLEIERGNLYYVNNIITWEQLQAIYQEAKEGFEAMPRFPSIGEQLKNVGAFLIGTVAGFLTAGPVGLFTGGAAATQKIIAEAKAKASANALQQLSPEVQKVQEGLKEREKLEASMQLTSLMPWLIGSAFAGAVLVYFGDDLKKLMK